MIASKTVYLAADRKTAVAAGPEAKFLLVKAGHEIDQATAEKYDGAIALIGSSKKAPTAAGNAAPENREAAMPKRHTRAKKSAK
jgi:hypothetical protein